ncbi:MAG TPA: hypothetical protein VGN95_11960 [Pyrinomonadaceae bacterium]|nr:hypothetical protein [Pyrinomonadaceae bacterium]
MKRRLQESAGLDFVAEKLCGKVSDSPEGPQCDSLWHAPQVRVVVLSVKP